MAAASVLFSAAYAPAHRIGAVPALRRPLAARVPPALLDGSAEDGAAFSAAAQLGREPGTCDPYDPKSAEYCSPPEPAPSSLKRTIRLGVLFFLWYSLNTAYNIGNKLVLTAFPMPWTAATWEVTSAAKAILSKKVLDGKSLGENLTPANMFAVLSILGFCAILPVSLALEGPAKASAAWSAALAAGYTTPYLLKLLACSGFLYYIYNEVAFLALAEVAPVTHAVTNTVKRVVIILASILVFKTTITPLGAAGSAITVAGALLYALAKNKYK